MEDIKVLKLVSGETIVALTTAGDSFIQVKEPIQFTVVSRGGYGSMVASEWLQTEQSSFKLRKDHIVAMAQPTELLLEYYFNTINAMNEPEQPEEPEDEYIQRFIMNQGGNSPSTIH